MLLVDELSFDVKFICDVCSIRCAMFVVHVTCYLCYVVIIYMVCVVPIAHSSVICHVVLPSVLRIMRYVSVLLIRKCIIFFMQCVLSYMSDTHTHTHTEGGGRERKFTVSIIR